MQVALNNDSSYDGGRLVYLSNGRIHMPKRDAGTVTIHNDEIVHGVSMMQAGTRYGLFFLKK
jgi:predicted 2-oxoglutarate/Fe(II)-dependent dioxygenase YbiX